MFPAFYLFIFLFVCLFYVLTPYIWHSSLRSYHKAKQIIMLSSKQIEVIYTELLRDLKPLIENHAGSMAAFCRKHSIDRSNLVKIFSENPDRKTQPDLSVGLYQRICIAIGIMAESCAWPSDSQVYSLSLKNYLLIDHNSIKDSMLVVSNS